jgi:hypothetical protein
MTVVIEDRGAVVGEAEGGQPAGSTVGAGGDRDRQPDVARQPAAHRGHQRGPRFVAGGVADDQQDPGAAGDLVLEARRADRRVERGLAQRPRIGRRDRRRARHLGHGAPSRRDQVTSSEADRDGRHTRPYHRAPEA